MSVNMASYVPRDSTTVPGERLLAGLPGSKATMGAINASPSLLAIDSPMTRST